MKQSIFLFAFILLLATSCQQNSAKGSASTTEATANAVSHQAVTQMADRVEVLDFYGTHRCKTCKAIEANSRYTLETYFAQAMTEGKLTFKVVNIDEPQNAEIAEKFEAAGTSLFLDVFKDGNETIVELTDFAFAKGNDKEAFSKELKTIIEKELKAL